MLLNAVVVKTILQFNFRSNRNDKAIIKCVELSAMWMRRLLSTQWVSERERRRDNRTYRDEWMNVEMDEREDFGLNDDNIISLYPSIRTRTHAHKYKIYNVKNDE